MQGVYEIGEYLADVSMGISHDTAQFAVDAVRRSWRKLGHNRYPYATRLLITSDYGGRNGYRNRLWKLKLQIFATKRG